MSIDLSIISVDRVVIHPIYERMGAEQAKPPKKATKLILLTDEAKEALETKLRRVVQNQSKSVSVEVRDTADGSAFRSICSLIGSSLDAFLDITYDLAVKLKNAQDQKGIDSGMVCVLDGVAGVTKSRFICVLRASAKSGFSLFDEDDGSAGLAYLQKIVLAEDTKLYKVGFFVEEKTAPIGTVRSANDFEVFVYDHLISNGRDDKAAQYFYNVFLGCKLHEDSKTWQRMFYDETLDHIKKLDAPDDDKLNLERMLVNYAASGGTVSTAEFAGIAFQDAAAEAYEEALKNKGVPERDIPVDQAVMSARTLQHIIMLNNAVSIKVPRSVFMDGAFTIDRSEAGYTTIRFPGTVAVDQDES